MQVFEQRTIRTRMQHHMDLRFFHLTAQIGQIAAQIFLERPHAGRDHQTAERTALLDKRHLVSALRSGQRSFQTSRAAADHNDAAGCLRPGQRQRNAVFSVDTRVHSTTGVEMLGGDVIAVVAADAGHNIVFAALQNLFRPEGIGDQRAAQKHQISCTLAQHTLGLLHIHDCAADVDQNIAAFPDRAGPLQIQQMRLKDWRTEFHIAVVVFIHAGHKIDDIDLILHGFKELQHFFKRIRFRYAKRCADAQLQNKIRANRLSHTRNNHLRQTEPVFITPAPVVRA